jgi:hypothetical protein
VCVLLCNCPSSASFLLPSPSSSPPSLSHTHTPHISHVNRKPFSSSLSLTPPHPPTHPQTD